MPTYFLGFIIPLLSFALQIWPRFIKRYFGVDTWRWLLFADYVRKNKKLPTESPRQYIVPSIFGYPPVTILFLSIFPKKFLEQYQFLFSPFFDLLHNYLIFIACYMFTGSIAVGIIAQIITALTPIVVIEASNLNSRMLSSLIYSVSFFSLVLYTITGHIYILSIAAIGLVILMFTHRFAIQAYLVSSIGLSIAEQTPFYILFFLAIFTLVYILSPKLYGAILREHLASLKFWMDIIDLRFAHQFRGLARKRKITDFIQQVYSLSTKNPFVYMVGNSPWILYFAVSIIAIHVRLVPFAPTLSDTLFFKIEVWALSLILWMALVLSIKKLRIFGEGQRYLEYSTIPMGAIMGTFTIALVQLYGVGVYVLFGMVATIMLVTIIYLQHKSIVKDRARSINEDVWAIIDYINKHNGKSIRLAMFPLQLGDAILYFTKCSILTSDLYSGLIKLRDLFPVLRVPLSTILKRYKINHIFFDRTYVSLEELKLTNYKILIDRNNFVLIKV